jgi:LacI family transcriptional regulator
MSIRAVARLAGVSATTVSLALHNSPRIPAATRRRILKCAEKVGYRPNAKLSELMAQMRLRRDRRVEACLGVISLYDQMRPWLGVPHLQRIFDGMTQRADSLGYRLEPLWLRAPGMTCQRFSRVLDARGIQGLLCFGSPNLDDRLPRELDRYAIVTQGVSIKTPLHRVTSHAYNDMWRALRKISELGYRRPGLVLGDYEGQRSAHAYLCVYLGWCQLNLRDAAPIPVLRLNHMEEQPFTTWLDQHQPDVIVLAHHYNALPDFSRLLQKMGVRAPRDVGVAVLTQILEGTEYSGLQGNQKLVGEWAVEMVVSRIMHGDFGVPTHPRIEMVEMDWIDGKTLVAQE